MKEFKHLPIFATEFTKSDVINGINLKNLNKTINVNFFDFNNLENIL